MNIYKRKTLGTC